MPIPNNPSSEFLIPQKDLFFVQEDNEAIITPEAETNRSWRHPIYTLPPEFFDTPTYDTPEDETNRSYRSLIYTIPPEIFENITSEFQYFHSNDRNHHNLIKSEMQYLRDCLKNIDIQSAINNAIHILKLPQVIRFSEIPFYINLLKKYFPNSSYNCQNAKFISKFCQEQNKEFICIFKEKIKVEKRHQKNYQFKKIKNAFHLKIIE